MQSFRTELENPVVEKEIIDLEKKIKLYQSGEMAEEKFRSLRLARGVYGQRQHGVQMVRIKLPFGRISTKQLLRIADISDEYSTGTIHLTTRQDIQIHFVSLDKTPELWAKLAEDDITLREACGNTVRNITASATAGIDPMEPFDVSPYAYEAFKYFLRNPVCQEMGRKFKIAFSSSDADSAFAYIHDVGLIPKIKTINYEQVRGFKVVVAGGLGSQPHHAQQAYEFLHEDQIIPFIEGCLRVFDRYGERANRNKARLKFLIDKIGLDEFLKLVEEEKPALKVKTYRIDKNILPSPAIFSEYIVINPDIENKEEYERWFSTNVLKQKQEDYFAVRIKVPLGNLNTETVRKLVNLVNEYAADEIRLTVNQGFLVKYLRAEILPYFFTQLKSLGLAEPGFDSTIDITACPGTDTCNLGISNSTAISLQLEKILTEEYPDLIFNNDIKIKISGCMNSCGQHGLAQIGFHGSSIKNGGKVIPALQLMLGGGTLGNGEGRFAERVIKIPSKRTPDALRLILNDYESNSTDGEYFNNYYDRKGKNYFYLLLKPLTDLSNAKPDEYIDWGQNEEFDTAVGIGECAGVVIDLVATLLFEAEEKTAWAEDSIKNGFAADSIYNTYSAFINAAKALLLLKDINCNTQIGILNDFNKNYSEESSFSFTPDFKTFVLSMNQNEATLQFAEEYLIAARQFISSAKKYREDYQLQQQAAAEQHL